MLKHFTFLIGQIYNTYKQRISKNTNIFKWNYLSTYRITYITQKYGKSILGGLGGAVSHSLLSSGQKGNAKISIAAASFTFRYFPTLSIHPNRNHYFCTMNSCKNHWILSNL